MLSGFKPSSCFIKSPKKSTLPLFIVTVADFPAWLESAPEDLQNWLRARKFKAKPGACALLPGGRGAEGAVVTVGDPTCLWDYATLPKALPPGSFDPEPELNEQTATALCLGFALGSYQFTRYKKSTRTLPTLVLPPRAHKKKVLALSEGICLTRDLVNTPASDMGPGELADVAAELAKLHDATFKVTTGDALLKKKFPMIHAVGRASDRAPRLIELSWGKNKHPLVTLVGKGVCFDTGGLDIKPGPYMKLMKKDMGGGALVLGLAHAIMSQGLSISLRVLVPAVENSVSGNAMRPLDVLPSRKGITVEVGDTDAEGRLILADALAFAEEKESDLVIDAATLTGAARVALGTGMPAIFGSVDATWVALETASKKTHDPLWRMPLHRPYRSKLDSKVADICNIGNDSYAGAITAALFLNEFVNEDRDWIHMDTMGFNLDNRPGRPYGGEALGLLALEEMLRERYAGAASVASSTTAASPPIDPSAPASPAKEPEPTDTVDDAEAVQARPTEPGPTRDPKKATRSRATRAKKVTSTKKKTNRKK